MKRWGHMIAALSIAILVSVTFPILVMRVLHDVSAENPISDRPENVKSTVQIRRNRAAAGNSNAEAEGWHSIHVYYGNSDGAEGKLGASSPMQMKQNYPAGSQVDQDKVVAALSNRLREKMREAEGGGKGGQGFGDQNRPPYFVDLAANDAVQLSNTLFLEKQGWEGLCIEPNPIYWYRLAHRKCQIAGAFVGGAKDMQLVDVTLNNEEFGGIIGEGMDNTLEENAHVSMGNKAAAIDTKKGEKRFTVSLRTLFHNFAVPTTIDYLSLDVEGAEELVMTDFPFAQYAIRFMTIERPNPSLQKLLKAHGYIFVMQLIFWGETLWIHESILQFIGMKEIEQLVSSTSAHSKLKPRKGRLFFNVETGEYKKKE